MRSNKLVSNKMKNVLFLIDNLGSGGAQRQIINVAYALKLSGYSINILIYENKVFYKKDIESYGLNVIYVPNSFFLNRIIRIMKFVKNSRPDTLISFLETPNFIACLCKMRFKKIRLITTERSAKESTFRGLKHKIFNYFERYSDYKCCNSEKSKINWEQHYKKYGWKLRVIYNIYNRVVTTQKPEKKYVAKNDGITHIVVFASYQELKNPVRLIEAVNLLSDREKEKLRISWYGNNSTSNGKSLFHFVQSLVAKYNLSKSISFNSESSNVYNLMSESDFVALFSTIEGLPNTICEGMLLGKPIIMSMVSDYNVLVGENGLICDPLSITSIKETLKKAIALTEKELSIMGKKSFEKANELFNSKYITEQWISLIEK